MLNPIKWLKQKLTDNASSLKVYEAEKQTFWAEIAKIHPDQMIDADRMRNDKGCFLKFPDGACLLVSKDEYYACGGQSGFYVDQMGIDLKLKDDRGVPHWVTIDIQAGCHHEQANLNSFGVKMLHNGRMEIDTKLKGDKAEEVLACIYEAHMPLEEAGYALLMRHDAFYSVESVYLNNVLNEKSQENVDSYEKGVLFERFGKKSMVVALAIFEHLKQNPGENVVCGEVYYDKQGMLSHMTTQGGKTINLGRHTRGPKPQNGEQNSHQ